MKRIFFSVLVLSACLVSFAQSPKIKPKKYPSLFWEITGNGLKKPSYLFGTMHVSSKMAFFLSDSFYVAIKNADVVSLETNPESWQADMDKYDLDNNNYGRYNYKEYTEMPEDYLYKRSLEIDHYDKLMEQALYMQPSIINNLLYRSYSEYSSDFEEDTYLDLYIYQTGKKLGKQITGVEQYGESMRLMMEAYKDAANEKNRKSRSYDIDDELRPGNLQDAYRSGNLDWLDSINKVNSESEAFDAKFIYRRNEIQANSMDSIMKRSTLFVGVGAAHLPGEKGVIELLRRKGYKLRPIMMLKRDNKQKEIVDKMRVPVKFSEQVAADGFFKVEAPGKLYNYSNYGLVRQSQYADMANGSYYMVTRVKMENLFWGDNEDRILRKIDSVLYENVPGKILSKTPIVKNGYKGLDITNKTRRGDIQRYNIFVTPFELIIFKVSGTGDYIKNGDEAKHFFETIRLKEPGESKWISWQPSYGGFKAEFPTTPFVFMNGEREYESVDKASGSNFAIIHKDLHNYQFAEEDTFDLSLMEESFATSEFIDTITSRKQEVFKGYPSLVCTYKNEDGSVTKARFLIQGPNYYTILAHGKQPGNELDRFLNSFEISPFVYGNEKNVTDTTLYYTDRTTWFPQYKKEKITLPEGYGKKEDDEESLRSFSSGEYKSKLIENDSTGEKIYVSYFKSPRYYYSTDSTKMDEFTMTGSDDEDTSWIVRNKKTYRLEDKTRVWEYEVSDTNSSRMIRTKVMLNKGVGFLLVNEGDTLTKPSSFVSSFFQNFKPFDTLSGYDPYVKKSKMFFDDFFSTDTLTHKKALYGISRIKLDTTDFPMIQKAISSLSWKDNKKYLDAKTDFVYKLTKIRTNEASDYLRQLYVAAGDTVELQHSILSALLKQQTNYSFTVFRDIITNDPPVLETSSDNSDKYRFNPYNYYDDYSSGDFMDELYDSLKLTRSIFPDILPLINLDDYESPMIDLLETMIDSNMVAKKDYEMYFSKFFLEAKHELKKQRVMENMKSIEKASSGEEEDDNDSYSYSYNDHGDEGNDKLNQYATLLLPYYDSNDGVKTLFNQMLASGDDRLKYNIMIRMIRSDKKIPDSLPGYFAKQDDYRYEFYKDLAKAGKGSLFPSSFNNQLDLAKSKLLDLKSYGKPDSLLYVDKYMTTYKGRKGYIYFFKYKQKKDDAGWKIATVGLIPADPKLFEYKEDMDDDDTDSDSPLYSSWARVSAGGHGQYSFSGFSDTRLEDDKPLGSQLSDYVKKKIYSKRKSAKYFYMEDNYSYGDYNLRNLRY